MNIGEGGNMKMQWLKYDLPMLIGKNSRSRDHKMICKMINIVYAVADPTSYGYLITCLETGHSSECFMNLPIKWDIFIYCRSDSWDVVCK